MTPMTSTTACGRGCSEIEDLREVPFLDELLREIDGRYPDLDLSRRIHELTRRVITRFVEDVVAEGRAPARRLCARRSAEDIRQAGDTMVCFSKAMKEADAAIKRFLYARMYRHPDVMRGAGPGRRRPARPVPRASRPSRS